MIYHFNEPPRSNMALIETKGGARVADARTDFAKIRALEAANVERHQNTPKSAERGAQAPESGN